MQPLFQNNNYQSFKKQVHKWIKEAANNSKQSEVSFHGKRALLVSVHCRCVFCKCMHCKCLHCKCVYCKASMYCKRVYCK